MGRHLSPRYDQVILVSGYPVLTAVNWSQDWCAICLQYQSSCAPKLESVIEHWLPCGADGRAGWGRCTVTWLPNFLGWVDLLTHGAPQARFARQSSAIMCLFTRSSRSIEIGIDLSIDKSIKVRKSDLFGIDSIGQSVKIDYTLVFFIHWFNFIFTDLIHLFNYDRDSSLSQRTMADFGLV